MCRVTFFPIFYKRTMSYNKKLTDLNRSCSTGKYSTSVLLYWPSDSEVNTASPRLDIIPYCPHSRSVSYYYYIPDISYSAIWLVRDTSRILYLIEFFWAQYGRTLSRDSNTGRDRRWSLILKSRLNILPSNNMAIQNPISVLLYRTNQFYEKIVF
jgi:hypothetical protein